MISNDFVALLFRLINFGIVAGLLGYFFIKRIIEPARVRMSQKKASLLEARSSQDQLFEHLKLLDQKFIEQQLSIQRLNDKIAQWRIDRTLKQQNRQQVADHIAANLEKKVSTQRHALIDQIIQKKAAPEIVKKVEHELEQYFQSEHVKRAALQSILDHIQESTP